MKIKKIIIKMIIMSAAYNPHDDHLQLHVTPDHVLQMIKKMKIMKTNIKKIKIIIMSAAAKSS